MMLRNRLDKFCSSVKQTDRQTDRQLIEFSTEAVILLGGNGISHTMLAAHTLARSLFDLCYCFIDSQSPPPLTLRLSTLHPVWHDNAMIEVLATFTINYPLSVP